MGAYIVPLAYNHNFDITSDLNFANDISKKFSANLTMSSGESNTMEKHEILSIDRKDSKRNISITKCTPSIENAKLYIVDMLDSRPLKTPIQRDIVKMQHLVEFFF